MRPNAPSHESLYRLATQSVTKGINGAQAQAECCKLVPHNTDEHLPSMLEVASVISTACNINHQHQTHPEHLSPGPHR